MWAAHVEDDDDNGGSGGGGGGRATGLWASCSAGVNSLRALGNEFELASDEGYSSELISAHEQPARGQDNQARK